MSLLDKFKDFGSSVVSGVNNALSSVLPNSVMNAIDTAGNKIKDNLPLISTIGAGVLGAGALGTALNSGVGSTAAGGGLSGIGSSISDVIKTAAPAAIGLTSAGGSSLASYASSVDYNDTMRRNTDETNRVNKSIADQNLGFQRENLEYNKALQQQIFNREDTSYQRTVNDMRAAGMSPLSMNGTNGAGEAIAVGSLNNGYQHQNNTNYRSPLEAFANIDPVGALSSLMQIQSGMADIEAKKLSNEYLKRTMDSRVSTVAYQDVKSFYDSLSTAQKYKFDQKFGLNDKMTPNERYAAILSKMSGTVTDQSNDYPYVPYDKYGNNLFQNEPYRSYADADIDKLINSLLKKLSGDEKSDSVADKVLKNHQDKLEQNKLKKGHTR